MLFRSYAGENIAVTSAEVSFYNERQKAEISLDKILEQDEKFGIGMTLSLIHISQETEGMYMKGW